MYLKVIFGRLGFLARRPPPLKRICGYVYKFRDHHGTLYVEKNGLRRIIIPTMIPPKVGYTYSLWLMYQIDANPTVLQAAWLFSIGSMFGYYPIYVYSALWYFDYINRETWRCLLWPKPHLFSENDQFS